MHITSEIDLREFKAWSGGKDRLDEIIDHQRAYDYISEILEEDETIAGPHDETWVNDFLWFDSDDMLAEAGLLNRETGKWYDDEDFYAEGEEPEEDENDD